MMKKMIVLSTLMLTLAVGPSAGANPDIIGYFSKFVHLASRCAGFLTYTGYADSSVIKDIVNNQAEGSVKDVGDVIIGTGHFFNQTLNDFSNLDGTYLGPFRHYPIYKLIGAANAVIEKDVQSVVLYLTDAGVNYAIIMTLPEEYSSSIAFVSGLSFTVMRFYPTIKSWVPTVRGVMQEIPNHYNAVKDLVLLKSEALDAAGEAFDTMYGCAL